VKSIVDRIGASSLPWEELDVDVVLESTGILKEQAVIEDGKVKSDGHGGHIIAGATKIILSVRR
jgi:glyceraldehyde-3-phosphate dehydrogenase/erythrose-4-phosphate dehydrogenase